MNGIGDTRVRIRGLRISGGSDLWAHGVRHGGMLSFIRADVRMDHCSIGETYGAAAVSMRRGNFAMADCYLAGAANGFVNLAEVIGSVERTGFGQPSRSGDAALRNAISLRASHVLVRGCTFADLPFTALRAGRSSEALVTASRFSGNAIAIMAVDGSSVHVDGCDFTGNGKCSCCTGTRPRWGRNAELVHQHLAGNGTQQEVDEASSVKTGTSIDRRCGAISQGRQRTRSADHSFLAIAASTRSRISFTTGEAVGNCPSMLNSSWRMERSSWP